MKKWEYKLLDSRDLDGGGMLKGKSREVVEAYFNQLGQAGWEIIDLNFREIAKGFEFSGVARRERVE